MLAFSQYPFVTKQNTLVYSLCTFIEGYPSVSTLDPLNHTDISRCIDDTLYSSFACDLWRGRTNNADVHKIIVEMMLNLSYGNDIVLLIDYNVPYATYLAETLAGYIYTFYGYIANEVKVPEDMESLTEGKFSEVGLGQLEFDLAWYRSNYNWNGLPNDPPED